MKAFFRCDAVSSIGFGHMSRCIALAEAFRLAGIASSFIGLFEAGAKDQIGQAGFERIDLAYPVNGEVAERQRLSEAMATDPASFLIVDSYRVDANYLSGLKSLERPTVFIDDFNALKAYPCDVVLNFTWAAKSLSYRSGPVLLLGPDYFPARRRLVELRPQSVARGRSGRVRNLLVAIGGTDPKRIAARIAGILRESHAALHLRVVGTDEGALAATLAGFAPDSMAISKLPDLADQLLWADACITGGGLIKYEAAFMGVPAAAISQNEGQADETRALTRAGLVVDLGLAEDRSDRELATALEAFLVDDALRDMLMSRIRDMFPRDPSAHAARAIVDAIESRNGS